MPVLYFSEKRGVSRLRDQLGYNAGRAGEIVERLKERRDRQGGAGQTA